MQLTSGVLVGRACAFAQAGIIVLPPAADLGVRQPNTRGLHLSQICRVRAVVIVVTALLVVGGNTSWSCDLVCVSKGSDKRFFKTARTAFIARVTKVEPGADAILEVEEVYKGVVGTSVIVSSGWGADCRYSFIEGRRYLLFSAPDTSARIRPPEICADPQPDIEQAGDFIKWVRRHKRVPIQAIPAVGHR